MSSRPTTPPDGVRSIPWLETQFALGGALLPFGVPAAWLGQSIEVYGVPTVESSTVSVALRWHGDRPAALWEQSGDPIGLTAPVMAPDWSTTDAAGETLWPVPPNIVGVAAPDREPGSFS